MEIEGQLINYFKEHVGTEVTADTRLIEDSVIDSMGIMELLAFIDSVFGVEFDMDDLTIENFETIQSVADLIESRRG